MTRIYWVFGLYSREQGRSYAFIVPDRKSESILPIIERVTFEDPSIKYYLAL